MSNKGIMCIQKSFNGRRHDKNIRRGDKSDENVIGDDDVKMYYCHICNVYVPNNGKCIEDHENGRRHRNKSRVLIPDDVGDDACKQRPRQKRRRTRKKSIQYNISDYTNLLYDYDYCEADFELYCYCRICDLTVLDNAFDVNEHLNSQCHSDNMVSDVANDILWRYAGPRQPPKRNLMKVPIRLAILGLAIFFTFRYFQSRGR